MATNIYQLHKKFVTLLYDLRAVNLEPYMLPCPTKLLFHVDCFGCGAQRAVVMVLQGNFTGAFRMFPAVYFMLMFIGASALNFIDRRRNYTTSITLLGMLTAVTMVVAYFVKNFILKT